MPAHRRQSAIRPCSSADKSDSWHCGANATPSPALAGHPGYVRRVNRRQRKWRHARRVAHQERAGRPRNVISLPHYPKVKKSHIVPKTYQRNFAVRERVAVHRPGRPDCFAMNVKDAGTRSKFYRRTRPDGTSIDDVETSLTYVEEAGGPVLTQIIEGEPLTLDRKNALAQFFGTQVVRGPAFFDERTQTVQEIVASLDAAQVRPNALRAAAGDVDLVRHQVRDAYLSDTHQLTSMLTASFKVAAALGSMHWQLLRFDDPLLAYSDHPVVLWPLHPSAARFSPLDALEVRVPVSPTLAILGAWTDRPDARVAVAATPDVAAQINASTVAQADEQWMHRPGDEPPVAGGEAVPISAAFEPGYGPGAAYASARRAAAARYQRRVRLKKFLSDIEIIYIS